MCGVCFFFFFFNDTATTEIYTLSLHDALPIWLITPPEAHTLISRAPARSCSRTARRHSGTPSHWRSMPIRSARSHTHCDGYMCRSAWPPVGLSTAPAAYTVGPFTEPSATVVASQTPRPPTSRTLVNPASRAAAASRATRMAATAGGVAASSARFGVRIPMKCAWQSHSPGMTAGTRWISACGVGGAWSRRPAYRSAGPSTITHPSGTGAPRPGTSTSASMRCMAPRLRQGGDLGDELADPAHPLGGRLGVVAELLRHPDGTAPGAELPHGAGDRFGDHVGHHAAGLLHLVGVGVARGVVVEPDRDPVVVDAQQLVDRPGHARRRGVVVGGEHAVPLHEAVAGAVAGHPEPAGVALVVDPGDLGLRRAGEVLAGVAALPVGGVDPVPLVRVPGGARTEVPGDHVVVPAASPGRCGRGIRDPHGSTT